MATCFDPIQDHHQAFFLSQWKGFIDFIGSKHVAILTKLNKVDVFDVKLIRYYNEIIRAEKCIINQPYLMGRDDLASNRASSGDYWLRQREVEELLLYREEPQAESGGHACCNRFVIWSH